MPSIIACSKLLELEAKIVRLLNVKIKSYWNKFLLL